MGWQWQLAENAKKDLLARAADTGTPSRTVTPRVLEHAEYPLKRLCDIADTENDECLNGRMKRSSGTRGETCAVPRAGSGVPRTETQVYCGSPSVFGVEVVYGVAEATQKLRRRPVLTRTDMMTGKFMDPFKERSAHRAELGDQAHDS